MSDLKDYYETQEPEINKRGKLIMISCVALIALFGCACVIKNSNLSVRNNFLMRKQTSVDLGDDDCSSTALWDACDAKKEDVRKCIPALKKERGCDKLPKKPAGCDATKLETYCKEKTGEDEDAACLKAIKKENFCGKRIDLGD